MSTTQSLQPRIKRNDSWSWKRRIVWTTRYGTQSTVQSMSIILGRWHRVFHVRALLAKRNGGEQEIRQVHSWLFLDSELLYKERVTPRAPLWEEARCSRVLHREFAQEEMQEEVLLGYPRPVHTRRQVPQEHVWHRSHCGNVSWNGQIGERRSHAPHHSRRNWCVPQQLVDPFAIFVGSDTMPVRHRADFKEAMPTLRQLKNQEDTAHQQRWKSYSSSWWNWQESWWHSSSEHHHDDGLSTDSWGKPVEKWLGQLFEVWFSEFIWCSTVQNSVTANSSSLSPTGGVKSISPIQQNAMKNGYDENNNYNKSDETKCADELQHHHQQLERHAQHAAHNAQQVHQWRRWLRRLRGAHHACVSAHSAHCFTLDDDTAHLLLAQVLSPFIVIHGHTHGAFSLTRPLPSSFPFSSCPSPVFFLYPELFLELDNPDRPGKSGLHRRRREWGHLELLHLSHRLWAQLRDLRRAQRLHQSHSPSWSLPRTRTWMTWHSTRCSLRHTEDKSTTAYQEAWQFSFAEHVCPKFSEPHHLEEGEDVTRFP